MHQNQEAGTTMKHALTLLTALLLAPLTAWPAETTPSALRTMIADLRASYPDTFTRADEFLSRLEQAKSRKSPDEMLALQREIAMANPLVKAQPILFVTREQYQADHHNTETIFHTGEPNCSKYRPGGALKILDPATGRTSVLLDPGPEGLVRDPELHFDGRKIIFSMRKARDENYSIYELEVDPSKGCALVPGSLRRLTNERDATDIDPCYLPDGKIVFSSTREPKYCHCNMHIMANFHRMDGDGANIHQISKNTLFDGHPTLLPNGRILYYRWEYVDRNFGDAQGLWTCNPDGTDHAIYWGNNMVSPAAVFDARLIPGTERVVCIFGSCHDRPWGALAIIDRRKGIDAKEAVERIWPEAARALVSPDGVEIGKKFAVDHFRENMDGRYEDPFPLVDPVTGRGGKYFLVSRSLLPPRFGKASQNAQPLKMGIFLVDIFGNEILLHAEEPGCFDPTPLAARPRPPVIPERRDYTSATGTMYVTDVYEGTHMQGVRRGSIKWLRVVESTEKRGWTVPLFVTAQAPGVVETLNRPAISWAGFETKRILGTVPVEPDGSAHFELPAEKFVYFQLLDGNGMMVTTMRSGTLVQPGEKQGCVGCHENRLGAWGPYAPSKAMARPPSRLEGWHGPARTFNYLSEIQPIWNKHCMSCHDLAGKAAEKLVLARDKELVFNASYVALFQNWGKPEALLNTVGLGLAPINPAYAIGSHQSRLVKLLKDGHHEVKLSPEESEKIITWIDIGGPYYPDYYSANPDNVAGRSPLTIAQTKRLEKLTGLKILGGFSDSPVHAQHRFLISFDRPELSPILKKLDPNTEPYREGLAIIRAGQELMKKNPEADQPGFVACAEHQARETKYQRLRERERIRREALADGRKIYDPGIAREK
jgi:hypothetical protein